MFNEASRKWNPSQWASLFKQIGARYVVLVSKHMDGHVEALGTKESVSWEQAGPDVRMILPSGDI